MKHHGQSMLKVFFATPPLSLEKRYGSFAGGGSAVSSVVADYGRRLLRNPAMATGLWGGFRVLLQSTRRASS